MEVKCKIPMMNFYSIVSINNMDYLWIYENSKKDNNVITPN